MNNQDEFEKVLDLKIYESDFEKIIIAVACMIQKLNQDKNNAIDLEDETRINYDIHKYKMLIGKLKTCKLYNED